MIETSKGTKENLEAEKKQLDDMKTQLQKSRAKDNQQMNLKVSQIQAGLESLNSMFLNVEELLDKAAMNVKGEEEAHKTDLDEKIIEEQKKLGDLVK